MKPPNACSGTTEEVPCLNMRAREVHVYTEAMSMVYGEKSYTHRVGIVPTCLCRGLLHKEAREDTVGM